MRVNSIGSFNSVRVQKKPQAPSFQADVRVDYRPLDDFPKDVDNLLRPILKRAEIAYENEGTDNMLFELKPISIGKKGIFSDSRQYGISVTESFKDTELARKEILENIDTDRPESKNPDIPKLRKKDPEVMKRLKIQDEKWVLPIAKNFISGYTEKSLIDRIKSGIHYLKYAVPKEPEVYDTEHYVSTGPYQGEGGGGY